MAWFVEPESVRLDVSEGQWIEVKKQLSYGDMQIVASQTRNDFTLSEQNLVTAYLLDWSLTGRDGKAVNIDTEASKLAALRNMPVDKFQEIAAVIDKHANAVESEKKSAARSGKRKSGRTSASAA